MNHIVIACVAATLLAGCATKQERAAADNDTCQSMGLKFGTPEFAQCRMVQDQRRDIALQNAARAMSAAGASLSSIGQPSVNVFHY